MRLDEIGISIQAAPPVFGGGGDPIDMTAVVSAYGHTKDALSGYKDASLSLAGSQSALEDWFEDGLGWDITAYDEAQQVIWNGFVNQVDLALGGRQITRGPLIEIVNRCKVVYSTIDTSVSPPVLGVRAVTALANDAASQARYGILEEVYSTSGATSADANVIRDTYLAERKDPQTSETLTLGQGGKPSVTLSCLGYAAYLNRYTYANTGTGTGGLATKLQNILAADPNALISSDYSQIAANALAVPVYENDDARAWELIKGLVARGDASANRYTFGIYAGRQAVYRQVPETHAYQYRIAEDRLELYGGGEVAPWSIEPAEWLFYLDFLVGRVSGASLREDPRSLFIESMAYTAPWGLSINGGKVAKLPQILARLGLGGGV